MRISAKPLSRRKITSEHPQEDEISIAIPRPSGAKSQGVKPPHAGGFTHSPRAHEERAIERKKCKPRGLAFFVIIQNTLNYFRASMLSFIVFSFELRVFVYFAAVEAYPPALLFLTAPLNME